MGPIEWLALKKKIIIIKKNHQNRTFGDPSERVDKHLKKNLHYGLSNLLLFRSWLKSVPMYLCKAYLNTLIITAFKFQCDVRLINNFS